MTTFNVHLRPICVSCSCEMDCSSNGVFVQLEKSNAYVAADLYKCPSCKRQVVSGFARMALVQNERPGLIVAKLEL